MELKESALILEGGGLRGAFTTGVLDAFIEENIFFPYTIGVSAGANNGLSYVARQFKRSYHCNIEVLKKYNYVGVKHYLRGKGYINLQHLIKDYPEKYFPLDFETYKNVGNRMVMVTSNCITGKAEYLEEKNDKERLLDICQASCSLPVLCPVINIDGVPMSDGGICDSIPLNQAMKEGFKTNVVVLTKTKEYRKNNRKQYLPGFVLRKYPEIRKKLINRNIDYNEMLDYIDELERKGEIFVIRPSSSMNVTRTTTDYNALNALYRHGLCKGKFFIRNIICS